MEWEEDWDTWFDSLKWKSLTSQQTPLYEEENAEHLISPIDTLL